MACPSLGPTGDRLSAEALREGLATRWLGREIEHLESTDSTNRVAAERAATGAPAGLVVIAEAQTAGRGRLGRSFYSPPGANLYASVVLRPQGDVQAASTLVLAAGIAVAEAVADTLGDPERVALKWPNDVQVDGRKVSGILVEASAGSDGLASAVLGIGVNLNVDPADFPADFRDRATSLAAAAGRAVSRVDFTRRLFGTLEDVLDRHQGGGFEALRPRFERWFRMQGQRVRVGETGGAGLTGVVQQVAGDGGLVLDTPDGERRVFAGDVSVLAQGETA